MKKKKRNKTKRREKGEESEKGEEEKKEKKKKKGGRRKREGEGGGLFNGGKSAATDGWFPFSQLRQQGTRRFPPNAQIGAAGEKSQGTCGRNHPGKGTDLHVRDQMKSVG